MSYREQMSKDITLKGPLRCKDIMSKVPNIKGEFASKNVMSSNAQFISNCWKY
jgi:hypothetical protein